MRTKNSCCEPWTDDELFDLELMQMDGKKWQEIASYMMSEHGKYRTAAACRDQYAKIKIC